MAAKMGRPRLQDPAKRQITVRLKEETMRKLDEYVEKHGITKGEAIRKGIEKMLDAE